VVKDFHDVLAALVAREVRFIVVGAHALAAHGTFRTSGRSKGADETGKAAPPSPLTFSNARPLGRIEFRSTP
jgi:hypothetical protein